MKRNVLIVLIVSLAVLNSCFNNLMSDITLDEESNNKTELSSANIKVFIPDYEKLARQYSRAIAPQTVFIRLSVADTQDVFIQNGELLELDMDTVVPIENAPANLPGGIWSATFHQLECKTYLAGSLKIELLDSDKRVITQGVNQSDVTVTPYQEAQAVFFTTPEKYNSISGKLSPGEMRFWKVSMMSG